MLQNNGKPAELFAALWTISYAGGDLPDCHGILDRALQQILNKLPVDVSKDLNFAVTSVGLRCLELPQILNDMQYLGLADISISDSVAVRVGEDHAYCMLYEQGLSREKADNLAKDFYSAIMKQIQM